MSAQSNTNNCKRQSVFSIEASGADPQTCRTTSQCQVQQRRKKVFDSADYFTRKCIMDEKERRRKEQEDSMQQQSRKSFEQACISMTEKYGAQKFQRQLLRLQKEKKKFDSADYFMEKEGQIEMNEDSIVTEEQDAAQIALLNQSDYGDKHFICCAKRNPLLAGKSKKYTFDSADYFMKEHQKSHSMTSEEWEDLLESEISKLEQDYKQNTSLLQQQENALCLQAAAAQQAETDKIVQIQSEKIEAQYLLNKKRQPLIVRGKNQIQFDSAEYFMQQQQQQQQAQSSNNAHQAPSISSAEISEGIVQIQSDLCERRFILKRKTIKEQVAASYNKKKKEFDSADYFMEKFASNSDSSISEE